MLQCWPAAIRFFLALAVGYLLNFQEILFNFTRHSRPSKEPAPSLKSPGMMPKSPVFTAGILCHIPGLLLKNDKNLILTDSDNSPNRIARLLLDYLQLIGENVLPDMIKMLVAEDLGLESEKLFSGTLLEASKQQFSSSKHLVPAGPRCSQTTGPTSFGLTEDSIQHSRGLITKNEVRAATLHQLQLPTEGVLWDIGAGSGSLSIEAARSNPELTVYAIEHKEEELENIKNNIVKFGCYNIVPVFGRAPEALDHLPNPHRVFIGGSSGSLPDIVALIAKRLESAGRLVINGVIEKTVQAAPELMKKHGFYR